MFTRTILSWFLEPETNWHKESLAYRKRANRHEDAIDPNYHSATVEKLHTVRDTSSARIEHEPAPKLNQTERRRAKISDDHKHHIANAVWERSWSEATGPKAAARNSIRIERERLRDLLDMARDRRRA